MKHPYFGLAIYVLSMLLFAIPIWMKFPLAAILMLCVTGVITLYMVVLLEIHRWHMKRVEQLPAPEEREALRVAELMEANGIMVTDESDFYGIRFGDVKKYKKGR